MREVTNTCTNNPQSFQSLDPVRRVLESSGEHWRLLHCVPAPGLRPDLTARCGIRTDRQTHLSLHLFRSPRGSALQVVAPLVPVSRSDDPAEQLCGEWGAVHGSDRASFHSVKHFLIGKLLESWRHSGLVQHWHTHTTLIYTNTTRHLRCCSVAVSFSTSSSCWRNRARVECFLRASSPHQVVTVRLCTQSRALLPSSFSPPPVAPTVAAVRGKPHVRVART